jgi:hypothetical protein
MLNCDLPIFMLESFSLHEDEARGTAHSQSAERRFSDYLRNVQNAVDRREIQEHRSHFRLRILARRSVEEPLQSQGVPLEQFLASLRPKAPPLVTD